MEERSSGSRGHWILGGTVLLALWALLLVSISMERPFWPLYDEAINGYYALQLNSHWTWRPFFFFSQLPPFLIWLLAGLYRTTHSLLSALRLAPSLVTLFMLPAAYWAARGLFSRGYAALFAALLGFGFWGPFFAGIAHQAVLMLLWEILLIGLLSRAWSVPEEKRAVIWAGLGFVLGSGFYTYFAWPLVALWGGGLACGILFRQRNGKGSGALLMGIPFVAALFPMAFAFLKGEYGSYFGFLISAKTGNDWAAQVLDLVGTLTSFLWGNPSREFTYGPIGGGFFDPWMGGAILLGLWDLWRRRREPLGRALFLGIGLLLAPALLTHHLTLVREIGELPLLSLAGLWGFRILGSSLRTPWSWRVLGVLLALSTVFSRVQGSKTQDFIHTLREGQKTSELEKAYRTLASIQGHEGPGWVLTSFSNDLFTYDRSLSVACYPFNLAQNPHLDQASGHWVAVVANAHFEPFLHRRFPGAIFELLSDKEHGERDDYNGGLMLAVFHWDGKDPAAFRAWTDMDRRVREISDRTMDLPVAQARTRLIGDLQELLPSVPSDPFLKSCYWEMIYTGYSWQNRFGDHDLKVDFPRTVEALEKGLQEGYPTAYFYNELGSCYALMGDKKRAKDCFKKAVRAPLDLTPASENLRALEERPVGSKLP